MKQWKETILPLFLMFVAILFDGFVANIWTDHLVTDIGRIIPRAIILMIILLSFHYNQKFMLVSVAVIGFLMDAYYLGFIGVYMSAFMLLVTIVSSMKQIIRVNPFTYTLVSILGITATEVVVYSIMRILGITSHTLQMFIVTRLSATLLFNGIVMLLFSYFIHRLVVNTLDKSEVR